MTPPPIQSDLQKDTLTLYGELVSRPVSWPGKLVFSAFHGAARTGLSAASSLVGAASLIVDADAHSVRSCSRDRAFDFVVNSLDEALRTLKNEIRQRRPLAIALVADPDQVTAEASARGLAPRFILSGPLGESLASPELPGQDEVIRLRWSGPLTPSPVLSAWLRDRNWSAHAIPRLRSGASAASSPVGLLQPGDPVRSAWLRHLSTYQRSVRDSPAICSWVSPEESRLLMTNGVGKP